MEHISIIVPSYKEPYLDKTIDSLLDNASDHVQIISVVDDGSLGMRGAINKGLKEATGKYIMKVDAHCCFAKGYDEVLKRDCKENWLMIPRRYPLNAEKWDRTMLRNVKDYHYISYPIDGAFFPVHWKKESGKKIDDTMTFQGSCYFAHREYFMENVGYLDAESYGSFGGEQIEVGLKYWLGGGEVKVNKNTWYAHLFKNKKYYNDKPEAWSRKKKVMSKAKYKWMTKHWMNNEEPDMKHKFNWLVEKFYPVPGWSEDRKEWKV